MMKMTFRFQPTVGSVFRSLMLLFFFSFLGTVNAQSHINAFKVTTTTEPVRTDVVADVSIADYVSAKEAAPILSQALLEAEQNQVSPSPTEAYYMVKLISILNAELEQGTDYSTAVNSSLSTVASATNASGVDVSLETLETGLRKLLAQ